MDFKHQSVLLEECISGLNIKADGIYIDGTAGGAGHSVEIAKRLKTGKLIAIDKDKAAIKVATARLSGYDTAKVVEGDFRDIPSILNDLGLDKVDGILLDLGVSSYQLDTPQRGFSYRHDAPLDMRMSDSGISAHDVINNYEYKDLVRIFKSYGEEKFSGRIAGLIVDQREEKEIATTFELVEIIKAGIPAAARREGGHPAKKIFQAIRIEVNGELEALEQVLEDTFERLNAGGRFVVITFHSLEDRIVKQKFKTFSTGCTCPPRFPICVCHKQPKGTLVNRKPILPSEQELEINNRSHSAKLRIIEKN